MQQQSTNSHFTSVKSACSVLILLTGTASADPIQASLDARTAFGEIRQFMASSLGTMRDYRWASSLPLFSDGSDKPSDWDVRFPRVAYKPVPYVVSFSDAFERGKVMNVTAYYADNWRLAYYQALWHATGSLRQWPLNATKEKTFSGLPVGVQSFPHPLQFEQVQARGSASLTIWDGNCAVTARMWRTDSTRKGSARLVNLERSEMLTVEKAARLAMASLQWMSSRRSLGGHAQTTVNGKSLRSAVLKSGTKLVCSSGIQSEVKQAGVLKFSLGSKRIELPLASRTAYVNGKAVRLREPIMFDGKSAWFDIKCLN